ncbi:MAG: hypothetical protein Q8Q09_23100 [Deltaproteobacteria bacterium]|nr:hypothetical protein [Deltaproteobacteria bacterium]
MKSSVQQIIHNEVTPLCEVHGVDLVALEWFSAGSCSVLRVTLDVPHGDPRVVKASNAISIRAITQVTRDISAALDALETEGKLPLEGGYQLEVSSPGLERPLQKRADFERFSGLEARIDVKKPNGEKRTMKVTLQGVKAAADLGDDFEVLVLHHGKPTSIESAKITRARLSEIHPAKAPKSKEIVPSGSRRQHRLAERERARAINEDHLARVRAESEQTTATDPAAEQPPMGGER